MIGRQPCAPTNGVISSRSTRKPRFRTEGRPKLHATKTWRSFLVIGPRRLHIVALPSQRARRYHPKVRNHRFSTCYVNLIEISSQKNQKSRVILDGCLRNLEFSDVNFFDSFGQFLCLKSIFQFLDTCSCFHRTSNPF